MLNSLAQTILATDETRGEEAQQYLQQSLDISAELNLTPLVMEIFVSIARLYAQQDKIVSALELLSLVEDHYASTYKSREDAGDYRAQYASQLDDKIVSDSKTKGRLLDWQQIVKQLSNE